MVAMLEYTRERLGREEEGLWRIRISGPRISPTAKKLMARTYRLEKLGSLDEWRSRLEQNDSKWASLASALKGLNRTDPGCKVILFSYFKRTLAYLQGQAESNGDPKRL